MNHSFIFNGKTVNFNTLKKMNKWNILYVYTIFTLIKLVNSVELTFELSDNARECFYEDIPQNTSCTLEFQVSELRKYCYVLVCL